MSATRAVWVKLGMDLSQYITAVNQLKQSQKDIEYGFKSGAGAMDNWQSTSVGLGARVSSLTEKITAQKSILANLQSEITAVSSLENGEGSEAAQKLQNDYNKQYDVLEKMNGSLTGYKEQLYNAATAEGKTSTEAQQMGGQIQKVGVQTEASGNILKQFSMATVGQYASVMGAVMLVKQGFEQLWQTIKDSAQAAKTLMALSAATNVAISDLQAFKFVTDETGVAVDVYANGLKFLEKSAYAASTGNAALKDAYKELGVDIYDANGKLKDSTDLFGEMLDALGNVGDDTERDALAMKLMGRSAVDLNPLIQAGSANLTKYADEAQKAGVVLDAGYIAILAKLDTELKENADIITAANEKIAASLSPATKALDDFWTQQWIQMGQLHQEDTMQQREMIAMGQITQAQIDKQNELSAAQAESGLSTEDFNNKLYALTAYLVSTGIPADKAWQQAIADLVNGITAESLAAKDAATTQSQLTDAVSTAYQTYADAVKTCEDAIKTSDQSILDDMGGMFDTIPKVAKKSGNELLKEQDRSITIEKTWLANLAKLKAAGVSDDTINQIKLKGAAGTYQDVATLAGMGKNGMTPAQLQEWIKNDNEKEQISSGISASLNAPLVANVSAAQDAYIQAFASQLKAELPTMSIPLDSASIISLAGNIQNAFANQKLIFNFPLTTTLDVDGADLATAVANYTKTTNLQNGGI